MKKRKSADMGLKQRGLKNNRNFYSSNRYGEGIALSYVSSDWMAEQWLGGSLDVEYLNYKEEATQQFEELKASFQNDGISSMDYARSEGVEREWELYHFFAQEEINAPNDIFTYINDEGQVDTFTDAQIAQIRAWQSGDPAPIQGIEGNHMKLVSDHPDNIGLATDPNNILFATETGHRAFMHGGNTHNATSPEYFSSSLTMDEQFQQTLAYNEDLLTVSMGEQAMYAVGGSVLLYSTVGLAIEAYKLRNDRRPWKQKRADFLKAGIMFTAFGAALSSVGFLANEGMESMMMGLAPDLAETAMLDIMTINGTFFTVALAGGVLRYFWEVKKGVAEEEARANFNSLMRIAGAEFAAFSLLGVGADLLGGAVEDTFVDLLIPDPTGILIASRLIYKAFKFGKQISEANANKQAVKECGRIRMDYLYDQALPGVR